MGSEMCIRDRSMLLTAVMAVTGMAATATVAHAEGEEGKVINIYSWNDEFRTRLEAIYPEVESTSSDGTVTTLKDGTEIHWIINPNQDGVYQQKLDEALLNQADASDDDKVDIFLTETDYVFKYTDKDADVACRLQILELTRIQILQISTISQEQLLLTLTEYREVLHGSAAQEPWYTVVILQKKFLEQMIRQK